MKRVWDILVEEAKEEHESVSCWWGGFGSIMNNNNGVWPYPYGCAQREKWRLGYGLFLGVEKGAFVVEIIKKKEMLKNTT